MTSPDEDLSISDNATHTLTRSGVRDYIIQSLGQRVFKVELSNDQLDNAIRDALREFSKRFPRVGMKLIGVSANQRAYQLDHSVGYGIFDVQFINQANTTAIYDVGLLGNLSPIRPSFMSEVATFLTWRKSFMRYTSAKPAWEYDKINKLLMIYCPAAANLQAGYFWYEPHMLSTVQPQHHDWILKYSLARAQITLANVRGKFNGALPGPGKDLSLNSAELRTEATANISALEKELIDNQSDRPPVFV